MASRKLNLNNYVKCPEEEATLIVELFAIKEQRRGLELFLKPKEKERNYVINDEIGNAKWFPAVKIDISSKISPKQYEDLVKWWFDNADEDYRQRMTKTYKDVPYLENEIQKCKMWLLTKTSEITRNGKYPKRRTDINKFLTSWLDKKTTFTRNER